MGRQILTGFLLVNICNTSVDAEDMSDVSYRFQAQWDVGERVRQSILEHYGQSRVSFDENGQPIPKGLSAAQLKRWKRLYTLCMSDGCTYCDAEEGEGSCESGTCGPHNSYCKPYMRQGEGPPNPICGAECADYAFAATLRNG